MTSVRNDNWPVGKLLSRDRGVAFRFSGAMVNVVKRSNRMSEIR